jgi:5'-3' exonuclease
LGSILTAAGKRLAARMGIEVVVSNTDEPGEGEHKLLAHMRAVRPASCTIYGLDADLILLAMLLQAETGADVRLLREAQEFESRGSTSDEWRHLTIRGLTECMLPAGGSIPDFVAAMSLLGNDFLPRSLTRTVRDDGIPKLLDTLNRRVWSAGARLVTPSGRLSRTALLAIVGDWAATEEEDMLAAAQSAADAARRPAGIADSPEETAMRSWQAQPARWAALTRILARDASGRESLVRGWRDVYYGDWRAGGATAYIQGLAWVWDYYSGRPVEQGWQFDEHLPPLWSDVAAAAAAVDELAAPPVVHATALPAWLHLLSVLPADSIAELLPPEKQRLIARAPWYWPVSWSLFDVGRTQMWECEPVLPTIPESVLRAWV